MYISFINIKNIEQLFNKYNINYKIFFNVNPLLDYRVIKEYDLRDNNIEFYTYYISYKSLIELLKIIDKNEYKIIEILKIMNKTFPNVFNDYFNSLNNS